MPRPPVAPALRREIELKLRLNKKEHAAIVRRAQKSGFGSVADFVRWMAIASYAPESPTNGDGSREDRLERARRFASWAKQLSVEADQALVAAERRTARG